MTIEVYQLVDSADRVFYLATDPITGIWIKILRPDTESLTDSYASSASTRVIQKKSEPFLLILSYFRNYTILLQNL